MVTRAKTKKTAPVPAPDLDPSTQRPETRREVRAHVPVLSAAPTTRNDILALRKEFVEAYHVLLERKNAVLTTTGSKERRQGAALFQADLVSANRLCIHLS